MNRGVTTSVKHAIVWTGGLDDNGVGRMEDPREMPDAARLADAEVFFDLAGFVAESGEVRPVARPPDLAGPVERFVIGELVAAEAQIRTARKGQTRQNGRRQATEAA